MGVPAAVFVYASWSTGQTGDRWIRPGGHLYVACRCCVAVAAAPWSGSSSVDNGDRLGRLGEAGSSRLGTRLGAMALGNGIELYTVMTRGTESDLGHTIFLLAFLVLIAASVLVGQAFVEAVERRRSLGWSAPPAGAPSRSPAPGSGRSVVARHRSRLRSAPGGPGCGPLRGGPPAVAPQGAMPAAPAAAGGGGRAQRRNTGRGGRRGGPGWGGPGPGGGRGVGGGEGGVGGGGEGRGGGGGGRGGGGGGWGAPWGLGALRECDAAGEHPEGSEEESPCRFRSEHGSRSPRRSVPRRGRSR